MDWLIKLASKVGGSVFAIAFIIFFAFIMWVVVTAFKYRKDIKNGIDGWIKKRQDEEKMAQMVSQHEKDIKDLKKTTNQYCDNRIHDREQSFEIQKQLTSAISLLTQKIDTMIADEKERQRAKLKDRIGEMYGYYHEKQEWNHMQKEALDDLIAAYENAGGLNSYVHDIVQPESYTWKLVD